MKVKLNKYLASAGISSRRGADEIIKKGIVEVNGKAITKLGYTIDPEEDVIEINGKEVKPEKKLYIMLNKPRLYLTTLVPEEDGKESILSLISEINERIFPVGRLDYDTDGLLLLTNDGEFANRIHHPSYEIEKVYLAKVEGFIDHKKLLKISKGAMLDKKLIKPDFVSIQSSNKKYSTLKITFHEGRKHLVKNYLKKFGHKVVRLKRLEIGGIKLGKLPPGNWRNLSSKELMKLKKQTGLE